MSEAVARAITNYGRRCRASTCRTMMGGPRTSGRGAPTRSTSATGVEATARTATTLLDETPAVRRHDVEPEVAQHLLGSLVRAESSRPSYDARVRAVLKEAVASCRASWTIVSQSERLSRDTCPSTSRPDDDLLPRCRMPPRSPPTAVGGGALLAGAGALTAAAAPVAVVGLVAGSLGCAGAGVAGLKACGVLSRTTTSAASRGARRRRASLFLVPGWLAEGRDDDDAFSSVLRLGVEESTGRAVGQRPGRDGFTRTRVRDWVRHMPPRQLTAPSSSGRSRRLSDRRRRWPVAVYATARDKVSKVVIDETIKRRRLGWFSRYGPTAALGAVLR